MMNLKVLFAQLLMITALFFSNCSKDSSPSNVLSVSFTIDKTDGEIGETITFTNTSKYGSSYVWDFGDGNSSSIENPTHMYSNAGEFEIILTANGEEGSASKKKSIPIWDLVLESTFYGDSVKYVGPIEFDTQPVKFVFYNQSSDFASANLVKHNEGYTHQDMLNLFVNGISHSHHPNWTTEVLGVYKEVDPNSSHTWIGNLEPGIYTLVSAETRADPLTVWYVAGLTISNE